MALPHRSIVPFLVVMILGVTAVGAWDLFGPQGFIKTPFHYKPKEADSLSFNNKIQPILSENCYHCHGTDSANVKSKPATAQKKGPAIRHPFVTRRGERED